MRDDPPTVSPVDPVSTVVNLMMRDDVGAVVVAEDNWPLGIITERDLLGRVINPKKDLELTVAKDVI